MKQKLFLIDQAGRELEAWVDARLIYVFEGETYKNEDVKYYFKSALWEYLFPETVDSAFIDQLKNESLIILNANTKGHGWMSYDELHTELRKINAYKDLDFMWLYFIEWKDCVEGKGNDRNQIALGYIRKRLQ